jgi:hypothetical protein
MLSDRSQIMIQCIAFIFFTFCRSHHPVIKMSNKHLKQCQLCLRWFSTRSGAYTKHIKTCHHSEQWDMPIGNKHLISKNPLLSLMSEDLPYNNDYHCDLYDDQSTVELNNYHNESNVSDDDDDNLSQSSESSLDPHPPIDDFSANNEKFFSNSQSSQFDAAHIFQVKLHNLIMTHKASLQMFDDICRLVIDYTSSPDISIYTKLQTRKTFLRKMEVTNQSHVLCPTNRNVQLSDDRIVMVPVFDMK